MNPNRSTSRRQALIIGYLPANVRLALAGPYNQARRRLLEFEVDWLRLSLFHQRIATLSRRLYSHLKSLIKQYRRFEREGRGQQLLCRFPADLNPADPFFVVGPRFYDEEGDNDDEYDNNDRNPPVSQAIARQRRRIRHSESVIRVRSALIALLCTLYEDIRTESYEEDEHKVDADEAEDRARSRMEPMLTVANGFLGNVQEMVTVLHRCIEEASVAAAVAAMAPTETN